MSSGPAVDNVSAAPLREVRDIDKAFPGVRAGVPTQPHVVGRVSGREAW